LFTWLSGSTYGRVWADVAPVTLVLVIAIPLAFVWTRELDLLALDDDTPRLVGVAREPIRLGVLITAAVLAAVSVPAVGVVGFIGLVAPHAARALVGARHRRVVPVAMLLGAGGLIAADTIGRTVIAPAQIPAGLIVALIGAPYFVYLLARTRAWGLETRTSLRIPPSGSLLDSHSLKHPVLCQVELHGRNFSSNVIENNKRKEDLI